MDLSLLDTLKQKLHEAKQFSDVWDYFLTNFGEKAEFMKIGDRARNSFLEAAIAQVGEQLFNRPVVISDFLLTRVPEHHFIHGTVRLENKLTSALYFDDIHKGMLCILWSSRPPETKFIRFTGQAMYDALKRSEN
jgi:hypothetical protein